MIARHRILVVEDNPLNMELVRDLLSGDEIELVEATTAEDALRIAAATPPDLVLMDLRLPDLDGYEVLRRLRATPATSGVPVVALTALAMKGEAVKARTAGFEAYLTKPIDTRTFPDIIRRHLGRTHVSHR